MLFIRCTTFSILNLKVPYAIFDGLLYSQCCLALWGLAKVAVKMYACGSYVAVGKFPRLIQVSFLLQKSLVPDF